MVRKRRPTWRRDVFYNLEYRFGDDWFDRYKVVSTKAEADKISKDLRAKGWQVRRKTRGKGRYRTYIICRRKK